MVLWRSEVEQATEEMEEVVEEMVARWMAVMGMWYQLEGEEQEEAKGVVARTPVK